VSPSTRRGLLLRLAFLLMLGGGLVVWSELRRPRDLRLEIDLTEALPGDVVELDVTVTRGGQALFRLEERYGAAGAPAMVRAIIRARPGPAEVDAMIVDAKGNARRTRAGVELRKDPAAVVKLR
jgi:hypothetical protein